MTAPSPTACSIPRYEIERVYEVEVEGDVARRELPRWRRGVDAARRARGAHERQRCCGAAAHSTCLTVAFAEGRNHEVKRYCQAPGPSGAPARAASAFGPLRLGNLPRAPVARSPRRSLRRLNGLRG